MSWRGCAFTTLVPFKPCSGRWIALDSIFVPVHKQRIRITRPIHQLARFSTRASLGPPDVPLDIKELDEVEWKRRKKLVSQPPPTALSDETKARLFEKYPHLKALDDKMTRFMQEDDYDPEDYKVYSWAYEKMRPWAPSRLVQVLVAVAAFLSLRNLWQAVRARVSMPVLVSTLVRVDTISNIVLTVVAPVLICTWAIAKSRNDWRTDGVRRMAIMHTLSSILLLPVAAVASVGHAVAATAAGAFVRLVPMSMSLWYWRDLRREAFLGTALLARVFRVWRFFTTLLVIVGGSCFRIAGIYREQQFPSASLLAESAEKLRLRMGKAFPVSFSLCNDPRGLFFGACLALSFGIVYGIYIAVFVTDFGRIKNHRKTTSGLTNVLLQAELYRPNEHPLKKINGLSSPENEESFLPSAAMMLRKQSDLITVDSGLLSSELSMPIFSFLDKEDEISEQEGVEQWMKPRSEQVPLSDDLSRLKRTRDTLLTWARPMDKDEADMSFAEFFDTLDDDEYRYDPDSGNWVFMDQEVSANGVVKDSKIVKDIMDARDETEISTADLKKVIHDLGDIDLAELASSPELVELLKHELMDEKRNKGDDSDDPSVTVFV